MKYFILIPSSLIFLTGTYLKLFGFENTDKHVVQIIIVLILCAFGGSFFFYINAALVNVNHDQSMTVTKIIEENNLK